MHPDPVPPAHAPHLPCPLPARRLILTAALLCAVNATQGAVIFKDDFSAYGVNSNNVNLNLPATNGTAYPATNVRQSGSVGTWNYLEGGGDGNSQIGNPATNAGQAGAPTYADYLLLAYTCSASSRLPINEALVQGQPLTISFDLGTVAAPTSPDNTWWSAFRLGPLGSTYPVVGGDADFAFLYRINKGVQVFTTGAAGVDIPPVTSSHFTMVFTGSDGTGSAFADKGSRVALYSGTTLLGRFDTGQLTQEFMNFSVQNAFASLDNLVVETGIPDFVANAFHLTQSAFDFTSGKLNLTWVSEAGKTYQVTHSNTLTGTWQPIGAMIDAVGALTSTSLDFVGTDKDFYRVEEIVPGPIVFDGTQVKQDTVNRQLFLSDSQGKLQLRLNYAGRAVLDRVQVNDTETIAAGTGACTGIQVAGNWVTTRTLATDPVVTISGNDVTLSQINYGVGGVNVSETWVLHTGAQGIQWDIQRQYLSGGLVDDTYFPGFDFKSMSTWTAGMLDTGGVAWGRYLGTNASYGAHSGSVTFFKDADCLKITTLPGAGTSAASRFSHQPSGAFTFGQTIATTSMAPKHDLRRSIAGVDLWKSFQVTPGTLQTSLTLEAKDANAVRYRGNLTGIDGAAVNDLLDTIGRYGVIDKTLMGGNGWLTGYICLHEPFHAEMGIALGSPDYTANMATSLNGWRDYALQSSGRVKSRWHHDTSDNTVPGSYDFATGYYECGWGTLIDSQPDYVINVAEQFDLSGDLTWLQAHKEPCERALAWLMARDSDGDGLVEALTDSNTQGKSSDWIDIVWASGENALVNAELYYALTLWSEREALLGDPTKAATYSAAAAKLKASFVKATTAGGFWDATNGWFAYWRNKDGSVHGNNLVTPVNFCAIAYGLADTTQRQRILDTMEIKMRAENLFHWPLCFLPYAQGEGSDNTFPTYENGDIFLSWGEVAVRSYAGYNPSIAVDYVNRVLTQYRKDGLSYQRYLRNSQAGAGDDILAGNSMTIVGLFRDIYGVRPQWNRLMLDPHLTAALDGTQLTYPLRGQTYQLTLGTASSSASVDGFIASSAGPFAVSAASSLVSWYAGTSSQVALTIARQPLAAVTLAIQDWPLTTAGARRWSESGAASAGAAHTVSGLVAGASYTLKVDGATVSTVVADSAGTVTFTQDIGATAKAIALEPV